MVIAAIVIATPYGTARRAAGDACVRHGRQRSANSGLRGTDAEHHSILSSTEQHHQASQYSFRIGVLPLYVHQPLAGNGLLDFVREDRRPPQLDSQLATGSKFHLIIATELRRNFTAASRGFSSEFVRLLLSDSRTR